MRVFVIDEHLNVVHSSVPLLAEGASQVVPPGLHSTLLRLLGECRADPDALHTVVVSEMRVIRMVPLSGSPATYAVWIEQYRPYANLLSSLKRFKLSSRELDVLLCTLDGRTAAETAERLCIAVSTATDHLNRLLQKTGARNKGDLIAKVLGWQSEPALGTEGERASGVRDQLRA